MNWLKGFMVYCYYFVTDKWTANERGLTPLIHPRFRHRFGNWQQNNGWSTPCFVSKVTFCFDDPSLLDDCLFTCKVAPHEDPTIARFFGVVYACRWDEENVIVWSKRFRNRDLRTPEAESELIRML